MLKSLYPRFCVFWGFLRVPPRVSGRQSRRGASFPLDPGRIVGSSLDFNGNGLVALTDITVTVNLPHKNYILGERASQADTVGSEDRAAEARSPMWGGGNETDSTQTGARSDVCF